MDSLAEPSHEIITLLNNFAVASKPLSSEEIVLNSLPEQNPPESSKAANLEIAHRHDSAKRRRYLHSNSGSLGNSKRIPLSSASDHPIIQKELDSKNPIDSDNETVSFSLEALLGTTKDNKTELIQNSHESDRRRLEIGLEEPDDMTDPDLSVNHTMKIPENMLELHKQESVKIRNFRTREGNLKSRKFIEDEEIEIRAEHSNMKAFYEFNQEKTGDPLSSDRQHSTKHQLNPDLQDNLGWFGSLLQEENSFVVVNEHKYLKLGVLGKGGTTTVYRVLSAEGHLFAYKRIQVHGSEENCIAQCRNYSNEIDLLNKLKGSRHIINLLDHDVNFKKFSVSMIMEAGDIDLAKVIANRIGDYDAFFTRSVWREMLSAVDFIHSQRIVHTGMLFLNDYYALFS